MAKRRGRRVLLVTGDEGNYRRARDLIDSGAVPIRNPWFLRRHPVDGPDWTGVADLESDEAVDRAGQADLVVALDGAGVLTAARLRTARGLPGARTVEVLPLRDKEILHRRARAAGLPTTQRLDPAAAQRHDFRTALAVRARGLPGVRKVTGPDELPTGQDLIHEKWVDAEICHVDGVALGGRLVFASVSRQLGTDHDFARGLATGGVTIEGAETRALLALAEVAVAALAIPDGAFHLELADPPTGPVLLEAAPCPSAPLSRSTTYAATGIDLLAEHLRVGIGLPTFPRRVRHDVAGYWRVPRPPGPHQVRTVPSLPPLRGEVTMAELPRPGTAAATGPLAAVVVRHSHPGAVLTDLLSLRERLAETVHIR